MVSLTLFFKEIMNKENKNILDEILDMEDYYMDSLYTVSIDECSQCEQKKIVYCTNVTLLISLGEPSTTEKKDFIFKICDACVNK
jgi:hypothetical protein